EEEGKREKRKKSGKGDEYKRKINKEERNKKSNKQKWLGCLNTGSVNITKPNSLLFHVLVNYADDNQLPLSVPLK
ncbi:hypothetical protein CXF78_01380, partial [Shewanella sp. 11B5]|uniref:hypothetical protein n=1 Tax=Shewanella sp. 11B5 TaxID=2058298 RepID=UPI000CA72455